MPGRNQVSPVLVINDETSEFVMTRRIEHVVPKKNGTGSWVFLEGIDLGRDSPLTPRKLLNRMFSEEPPCPK